LRRGGWRVLRFWNNDILENRAGILELIAATLGPYIATEPLRASLTVSSPIHRFRNSRRARRSFGHTAGRDRRAERRS
jgi:hypothetical protein